MKLARPTSALLIAVLMAIALVVGRLTPPMISRFGGTAPLISWAVPITLLGMAVVVAVFAWSTWQSLHKKHERMTATYAINMLSLAKACAVVGALVAGFYGGFAMEYLGSLDAELGKERFIRGLACAGASLLLLSAGLLLERSCRLPGDDDDQPGGGKAPGKGRTDPSPA